MCHILIFSCLSVFCLFKCLSRLSKYFLFIGLYFACSSLSHVSISAFLWTACPCLSLFDEPRPLLIGCKVQHYEPLRKYVCLSTCLSEAVRFKFGMDPKTSSLEQTQNILGLSDAVCLERTQNNYIYTYIPKSCNLQLMFSVSLFVSSLVELQLN